MNPINVLRLASRVYEERGIIAKSQDSLEDREMCKYIVELLDNHAGHDGLFMEISEGLDILDNELEGTEEAAAFIAVDHGGSDKEAEEPVATTSEPKRKKPRVSAQPQASFEYRKNAVAYWLNEGGGKRHSLSAVKHLYKLVKSEWQLYYWKKQLEKQSAPPIRVQENSK